MKVVGVDPGANGGVACYDGHGWMVAPLPTFAEPLADLLRLWGPDHVGIEVVHAMPKQGVRSMFSFGRAYGQVHGVCGALGLLPIDVLPMQWQTDIGVVGKKKEGRHSVDWAAEEWPDVQLVQPRCRVPHDGIADAMGIAWWVWNKKNY